MGWVKNTFYEMVNVATGRYMNLSGEHASGVVNNGNAVDLYSRTGSYDQHWCVEYFPYNGATYLRIMCRQGGAWYTLNRHSGNNNCIVWHVNQIVAADSALELFTVDDANKKYRIALAMTNPMLYLTAVGNQLYWRPYAGNDTQLFQFYSPGTDPGPDPDPGTDPLRGLDTGAKCTSIAQAIHNAGYSFVGRYLCRDANSWKLLKADEVAALHNAGVQVFSFYQDSNNSDSAFSYDIGYEDAGFAIRRANEAGQPAGTIIYFAVDYDASASSVTNNILPYFRGVRDRLSGSGYGIGVYGSGAVCQAVKQDNGLATHSCLSKSYGWRGYNDYLNNQKYDLLQGAYVTISGTQFDLETSRTASFGQW